MVYRPNTSQTVGVGGHHFSKLARRLDLYAFRLVLGVITSHTIKSSGRASKKGAAQGRRVCPTCLNFT